MGPVNYGPGLVMDFKNRFWILEIDEIKWLSNQGGNNKVEITRWK